jgi:hypothetical protein
MGIKIIRNIYSATRINNLTVPKVKGIKRWQVRDGVNVVDLSIQP